MKARLKVSGHVVHSGNVEHGCDVPEPDPWISSFTVRCARVLSVQQEASAEHSGGPQERMSGLFRGSTATRLRTSDRRTPTEGASDGSCALAKLEGDPKDYALVAGHNVLWDSRDIAPRTQRRACYVRSGR